MARARPWHDGAMDDTLRMLTAAQDEAAAQLAEPGDWLSGAQRVAVWAEARDSATNPLDRARREAISPAAVADRHPATAELPAPAVDVVHRVASDPGRLTRAWADDAIVELGEETYAELVGVTGIALVLDRFRLAIGQPARPLPAPVGGEPARVRPDDVGDVGAWVAQTVHKARANVSRALSLVPRTNQTWRVLVDSHYTRGAEFYRLVWDRPLSRPQVELVAARTTSLHECFY